MTNRRKFLRVIGGGVIVAAVGTTAWALTRDPSTARQPWADAGQTSNDPRRRALSYAILAPNPHNRQPWLADLSVDGEITLHCQLDRRLEHTDPYDRQITIGLGAFVELLRMAAAEDGFETEIDLFPNGDPYPRLDERPVARIRFVVGSKPEPDILFAHALDRRTNRNSHDMTKPVAVDTINAIARAARTSLVGHAVEPGAVGILRDLTWKAMFVELTTRDAWKESIDLTRIGKAEIDANPDGVSLSGPFLEGLYRLNLLSKTEMLDKESAGFRQMLPTMKAPFDQTTAFMWLKTPGNSRKEQINAGRDYIRINLAATGQGVAMQPLSQALQEFTEMEPLYAALHAALGAQGPERVQMLTRIGYAAPVKPSPRWPFESRIVKT